ncbi:unnamed protein product [Blepharisma stoltei]|uniref:RanBP2-type domain-containing protein n=1 Tax=Blepharisma stoltei TaxID=1481888 RepID=A0AAU9J9K2_9CILI|nr:unnamed protein product [Blepharisma stoltei]
MRSDSPPSSPSPPRTTINEIPISIRTSSNRKSQASPISLPHETSANRNSQASSISFSHGTSPILNSQASAILVPHGTFPNRIIEAPSTSTSPANSPTQRHYPETYIGPLPATYIGPFPPRPEPVAHHSSPQELQQGNNQSDSFRLANQSPPTLEPNANSPAKKQAESKRPCAKKVSFAEEMLSSSPNNDPIGSQRNIGNSNSQDSSNPSNEAPRPAMKAPKNYIRPPNEENRQIRQLETTENQSSGQPEQIARDLANTTISSSSINNQDRISINLNNESQIKVVEVEIKDKSHQSLGSIEFKLNLRPSEAEIPNGRENFWGCPICGNINSSKIEFCPMCIAHRYWANS